MSMYRAFPVSGFLFLVFCFPFFSYAALLYLDPGGGTYGLGDTFIVSVRLDNEGECVNAAEVTLTYPVETLRAVDFGRGGSIVNLWVEEPAIDTNAGTVSFAGGIPGGYCGRIQGDPALSNVLGKVVFTVIGAVANEASVNFSKANVHLNDGLGTKADLETQSALYTIQTAPTLSENAWLAAVAEDTVLPDPFTVEVQSTRGVFGGRYYVVFSTVDKQSGIDHYEIFERGVWREARSPYQLRDRSLEDIRVRAIDKAGNERLGDYTPGAIPPRQGFSWDFVSVVTLIVLLVLLLAYVFLRKYLERGKDEETPSVSSGT